MRSLLSQLVLLLAAVLMGCGVGVGDDANRVTQKEFDAAVQDLRSSAERATAGDFAGAEAAFLRMHAFTHRLDSEMRRKGVADEFVLTVYEAVTEMELNMAGPRDPQLFATQGRRLLELLREAAAKTNLTFPER